MKNLFRTLSALAFIITITGLIESAHAQSAWEKPYQQWTKTDIEKIASDSPWAQVRQADIGTASYTPAAYVPAVTIRLRSALPIRQALVRLKQIEAKYDRMNDKERADFDAKMKGVLECPACTDSYVITLGPPMTKRQVKSGIGSLRDTSLGLLAGKVYIANERGERRELIHFIAPKHDEDEATFFFPRLDEKGQPLITPVNKRLLFFFEAKNLRTGYGLDPIPQRFEFDVSKMIVNGKVEF